MQAAEEDFEAGGRKFRAGCVHHPRRRPRARSSRRCKRARPLRRARWRAAPTVTTHDLDVPRIGYVHSWQRTQDEGWVRAAFDTYGVPYTYFADSKLREGNLRAKYDVIVFPHVGGTAQSQVNGIPKTGGRAAAVQEDRRRRRTSARIDQSDDIRGGMGIEGLMELVQVRAARAAR